MNSPLQCKEEYAIYVKAIVPSPKIPPSLNSKVNELLSMNSTASPQFTLTLVPYISCIYIH